MVRAGIEKVPAEVLDRMTNLSILVQQEPTRSQLSENGLSSNELLFGLYEGVPLTERGEYVPPLPDVITIFQKPNEQVVDNGNALAEQVETTVLHEVAHYFGFSDEELHELGLG
ncbi:MAG: metallopeptidase family protein [Dehalococcoidia bacterium]